jgi:large subunit ribosomal protein L27
MAHHKAGGSTKNGRDSAGRRLGLKVCGGATITKGAIIVRQRGSRYFPALNVKMGRDHTLFALIEGKVEFKHSKDNRVLVSVVEK